MDSIFANVPGLAFINLFFGIVEAEAPHIVYWASTFIISISLGMIFRSSGLRKACICIAIFVILNIPPLLIPVYTYYEYSTFCKTEAYYKINETIELGPEHWDEKGRSNFYPRDGLGFKSYKTEDDEFTLVKHLEKINESLVFYKNDLVSKNDGRIILEYSNSVFEPRRFPAISKMYRKFKPRSCSQSNEGSELPHLAYSLDEVFLLKRKKR